MHYKEKKSTFGTLFQFVINLRVRGRCFFFAFTDFADSERVLLEAAGVSTLFLTLHEVFTIIMKLEQPKSHFIKH